MSTRNKKKRIFAAILIIGDEILSGRTQDANTSFLAKWLNERGVQLKEVRIIPDNLNTIVTSVNLLRKKYDYLFTTAETYRKLSSVGRLNNLFVRKFAQKPR